MTNGLGEAKDLYGLGKETIDAPCTSDVLCQYHEKRRRFNPVIPDDAPFEKYEDYEAALAEAKVQGRELIGGWYVWKPHFDILQKSLQRASKTDGQPTRIINVGIASGAAFEGLTRTINSFIETGASQVKIDVCDSCITPLAEINQRFPGLYDLGKNLFAEPIETLANRKPNQYDLALVHYTLSFIKGIEGKRKFLQAARMSLTDDGDALVIFTTNDKDFKTKDDFIRIATEAGFKKVELEGTTDPFDGPSLGSGKNFVAHLIK